MFERFTEKAIKHPLIFLLLPLNERLRAGQRQVVGLVLAFYAAVCYDIQYEINFWRHYGKDYQVRQAPVA